MMIGLKRGAVALFDHKKEWETEAQNTISRLKNILGDVAKDIQHIGSTSIPSIKAKPIIDIAVAVDDFNEVLAFKEKLENEGFYYRPQSNLGEQLLFASGSFYDGTGDLQTHFIHVVRTNSMEFINYINFRDYLNSTPSVAKEYENLKLSLARQVPIDCGREKYLKGKHEFIVYTLRKALDIKAAIHYMSLAFSAFAKIAMGNKTIELRLNDEKRQKINVGDTVVFNCNENSDIITAKVKRLYKFADFKSLYDALPLDKCGYAESKLDSAHYTDMEQYYLEEQIKKYGALGMELCDMYSICDVKDKLSDSAVLNLLAPSVFNPTPERLNDRAEKYTADKNISVYACQKDSIYAGIVVFRIENGTAEILDIAVKPECQGKGIGSKLIDYIFSQFSINKIIAETDDDAIGFYKKYGFSVTGTKVEFDTKRYVCVCKIVTHHYDLLVDENNDPIHDPKPLRDYMDKWDGQAFIDSMELDKNKSVLEIGIGTGRLAVRVAPLCGEFCGIDISPKTIDRAKENLLGHENVKLICDDFLACKFERKFDVIYSSLTFMHIKEKQTAINKVATLLNDGGKFVLSIDKNRDGFIDTGTRKIRIFPDAPENIKTYIANSGLLLIEQYETEFAHIFEAQKQPT